MYLRAAALPELAPLLALLITSSLPRYAVGAASGRLLPRQRDRRPAAGAADPAALTAGVAVLLRQHHPAHLQANPFPSASLRTVFTGCQNTSGAKHRKSIWSVVWFFGCRVQQLLCSCEARSDYEVGSRCTRVWHGRYAPCAIETTIPRRPASRSKPIIVHALWGGTQQIDGRRSLRATAAGRPSAKCRHGNHSLRP